MDNIELLNKIKEELLKEGDSEKAIKVIDTFIYELQKDDIKIGSQGIYNFSTAFNIATLLGDISVVPKLTQEHYTAMNEKPLMWILSTKEEADEYTKSIRKVLEILSNLCDGNCQECEFDHCKYLDERRNNKEANDN